MAVNRLANMRYKTFIWPNNPRTYSIRFERRMVRHDTPYRKSCLEAMGMDHRVMQGEGEFFGPQAYEQFKQLACLFYENTPGVLYHPVWQTVKVYFVGLALEQEPRSDYVRYSFEFWECGDEEQTFGLREIKTDSNTGSETPEKVVAAAEGIWYTVVAGDTLWAIAQRHGSSLAAVIDLNPQIKNPNLIYPGERVRVKA